MDRTSRATERLAMRSNRQSSGSATERETRNEQTALSAGSGMTYRDEYGVKMTDEAYNDYKDKESTWSSQLSTYSSQLDDTQKKIADARAKLNNTKKEADNTYTKLSKQLKSEASKSLNDLYNKEKKSWINVRVVSKDDKIEQVYKIPKSAIGQLSKMGYHQGWVDGGKNYNISVVAKGGGKIRGKELHQAMNSIATGIKDKFFETNKAPYNEKQKAIQKQMDNLKDSRNKMISSYTEQLNTLYGYETNVLSNRSKITNAKTAHQNDISSAKAEYADKLAKRRATLGVTNA